MSTFESDFPKLPKFNPGPLWVPILIAVVVFSALGSIFYQVDPSEVGVVQRFGKYVRQTQPGLHMKFPFGIETVKLVRVTHVFKEEFGFRTVSSGVRTVYDERDNRRRLQTGVADPYLEESLMLTGDLNMAIVEWIVQYTVKDPVQYAFRVRDPKETIRNMSEAVMRLVIGDHTINEVLTAGRTEIQMEVEEKLQTLLNDYGAGIKIQNVILQDVTPPNQVKASFNEVNEARQEREKVINQAWEEYNRVIPRAKGQAEQQIRSAEGYAISRINKAEGDANRFLLTLGEYKKAPEVTRRRLYLETMEKVYPQIANKVVVDDQLKGVLPLLNLNAKDGEGKIS